MIYELALLLSTIVFAVTVMLYLRSPAASMLHPGTFYLLAHGLLFVFRPWVVTLRDYDLIYKIVQFMPTLGDKLTVLAGANLCLVVFMLAATRIGWQPLEFPDAARVSAARQRLFRPFMFTFAMMAPVTIMSLYTRWQMFAEGLGSTMIYDKETGYAINTTTNGYFTDIQLSLASLSAMFAYLFRFRWWSWLPLVFFVLVRGSTGGRGPFVFALVAVAFLYLFEKRRRWFAATATGAIAVGAVLFAFVGADRGAGLRSALGGEESNARIADVRFLEGMDFANLEYFEYMVHTVPQKTGGFDYFVSNLQIFTEPIPRVLWDAKPVGAPIKFFELMDYGNPFLITYSLPGIGWFEWGYLGIVMMALIFAFIYGKAYAAFSRNTGSPLAVMAYCLFAATLTVTLRDGTLLTVVRQAVFYLLPVVLTYGFVWLASFNPREQSGWQVNRTPGSATIPLAGSPAERRRALAAQAVD